ncbi:MAG TPA: hypothetical protein DFR83_04895 [Deltaproteobacteria bacterium]|nr:hypothetical protein [Deltaproteobacteria bacterium]
MSYLSALIDRLRQFRSDGARSAASPLRATSPRARLMALGFGLALLVGLEGVTRLVLGGPRSKLYAYVPSATGTLTRTEADKLVLLYREGGTANEIPLQGDGRRPRVVWLGGSSLRGGNPGMPLERETAQLVARSLGVESVNMGGPGLDSGHLLGLLDDVLSLSPDAVVIYTGHNDVGNETLMARYSGARFQWITRVRWLLRHSRLFTALETAVRQRAVMRLPQPTMSPQYTVSALAKDDIHERYRQRIGALMQGLRAAGVRVVIATPVSNPTLPWLEQSCPDAMAQLGLQGRAAEAYPVHEISRQKVAELLQQQDCSDLRWVLARLDQDRTALDELRDIDPYPLRADRGQIAVVRELATEYGAVLADSNAHFRELGGGIEHSGLFDNQIHLNETGHRVLANVIARALAQALGRQAPVPLQIDLQPLDLAACGDLPCRSEGPPRRKFPRQPQSGGQRGPHR